MARLLTPYIEATFAHAFENVAIADLGALEREADALEIALEAEVGHYGCHHAAAA